MRRSAGGRGGEAPDGYSFRSRGGRHVHAALLPKGAGLRPARDADWAAVLYHAGGPAEVGKGAGDEGGGREVSREVSREVEGKWLTVRQLAFRYGLSTNFVHHCAGLQRIAERRNGRLVYPLAGVIAFEESREAGKPKGTKGSTGYSLKQRAAWRRKQAEARVRFIFL